MKVLLFNTLYYPNQTGGAEKSVQLLAEGLLKRGVTPVIVTTALESNVDSVNGVKVYYLKTKNLYWAFNSKDKPWYKKNVWHLVDSFNPFGNSIIKIFREEKPDVVHTNNLAGFSVNVWRIAKKQKVRIVHTLRDYYMLCPSATMFKGGENCETQCHKCKILSIPKKKLSNNVDVVVGISEFIMKRHKGFGYFPNAESRVIYNSVINNAVLNKKKNEEKVIIGYVGSLSPNKGVELLLKGFIGLGRNDTELHLYGKGISKTYEDNIRVTYKKKNIVFKGYEEIGVIYKSIDILVVPSLWNEPFGRIVPEAYSYGVPVLVSNRGGLKELVNNGRNGYVFDPNKPNDLFEKIRVLLDEIEDKPFVFDIAPFSEAKIIEHYIECYNFSKSTI